MRANTDFWHGELCEYCGGQIKEKQTALTRKRKSGYVVIENVPTGVCTECGTRYYAANVLKTIDKTITARTNAKREVQVPVFSL